MKTFRIISILTTLCAISAYPNIIKPRQFTDDDDSITLPIHFRPPANDPPILTPSDDPCFALVNRTLVPYRDALACFDSFPPLPVQMRNQILDTTESFLNLYPYYDVVRKSPDPKFPSSIDIKARLNEIRTKQYTTDRAFHQDIAKLYLEFKDGHTRYTNCYNELIWVQPWSIVVKYPNAATGNTDKTRKPVVEIKSMAQRHFVETMFRGMEDKFEASYRRDFGFNPEDYIGAEILEIDSLPVLDAAAAIALQTGESGVKDNNGRFNGIFSRQKFLNGKGLVFTDSALSVVSNFPEQSSRNYKLQFKNGTIVNLTVPWLASGFPFEISREFIWEKACLREGVPSGTFPIGNFTQDGGSTSSAKILSLSSPSTKNEFKKVIAPELFSPFENRYFDISIDGSSHIFKRQQKIDGLEFIGGDNYTQFYNLPDGTTSVWLFSTVHITGEDTKTNMKVVLECLAKIQSQKRKLLIDVSGNGGGLIALGYAYMKYFFSDINLPLFNMRYSEMLAGIVKAYRNPELAKAADSLLKIDRKLPLSGEPAFVEDSWVYPSKTKPENVDGIFTSKYAQPELIEYKEELIKTNLTQYNVKQDFWNADTLLILSDGNCGSMCSWITHAFAEFKGIKTYVYGGLSDVVSGNTFAYAGFEGAPAIPDEYTMRREIVALMPALPNVTQEDIAAGIVPGSAKSWHHLAIAESLEAFPVKVNWSFPISNTFTTEKSNKIVEWTYTPADFQINIESPFENRTGLWFEMAKKFGNKAAVETNKPGEKKSGSANTKAGTLGLLVSFIIAFTSLFAL